MGLLRRIRIMWRGRSWAERWEDADPAQELLDAMEVETLRLRDTEVVERGLTQ